MADEWVAEVTPESAGWTYAGLRVADLAREPVTFATGDDEMLVLPLSGSCAITADDREFVLNGRESVFAGVTDFVYIPVGCEVTLRGEGRVALPAARATRRLEPRYQPASAVPIELRGAGQASRQVNNFCSPEAFECDKLVSVEVLTPSGNWSSYPPHKHDEFATPAKPGGPVEMEAGEHEAVLEEIYYFEGGPGYQRVYTSGPGREIEVLAEVSSGDVVLVPYGYHGPSMAPPGYDLYYLNVLAGPGEKRTMAFCDDPRHAWIRSSWEGQPIDRRLPFPLGGGR